MSPRASSPAATSGAGARRSVEGGSTRELLVELAATVFAEEGYSAASVRDLGRRAGVTSGAIYGNFRGKAALLAEAVDARLTSEQSPAPDEAESMLDIVAGDFARYRSRAQLMSLLLEGASAARVDPEVRERLKPAIERRIKASAAEFNGRRAAGGIASDVDLDTVAKLLLSMEIGLRALVTLGIAAPTEQRCADAVAHFIAGLYEGDAPARSPRAKKAGSRPAATAAKRPAKKSAAAKAPGRKRAS